MFLLTALLAIGCVHEPEAPRPPPVAGAAQVSYDLVDVSLAELARYFADTMGREIRAPEAGLDAIVTMRSDGPATPHAAWEHFVRVFGSRGYVVTADGEAVRIVLGAEPLGEDRYRIDPALVRAWEAEWHATQRIAHRGPDGNPDGERLIGIPEGSVLRKLGLGNGDVVHRIDSGDREIVVHAMIRGVERELRYDIR